MKMTYSEAMKKLNGKEFKVTLTNGLWLGCSCWTDDPEVLDWDASFDLDSEWGGIGEPIGRYDMTKPENEQSINNGICQLISMIEKEIGGKWTLGSDFMIVQCD